MRTTAKLIGAFIIFAWIVLAFLSHHQVSARVPVRLKSLAKYYRDSIGPERLRTVASNILIESSTNLGQSNGRPVRDFPAPANPWIVRVSSNSIVQLVSLGGFASYSLTIGPEGYVPPDLRAEEIAPGIYVDSW